MVIKSEHDAPQINGAFRIRIDASECTSLTEVTKFSMEMSSIVWKC